jgi:hypothetical protein
LIYGNNFKNLGLAPQPLHHPLAGLGGAFSGPPAGIIGGPSSSTLNSPLLSSPPLPYLPPARRQDVNSSPEGSIPTAPSPLAIADSPQAVTPPPPLLIGGHVGSGGGGGWPSSSFFHLAANNNSSPQHRAGHQQHQHITPLSLMGQLRPAVPPFGGPFSPFQVHEVFFEWSFPYSGPLFLSWILGFIQKMGTFSRKFGKGCCVPRTALSQGPLCPKDRFVPRTVSLQNFWDEKSLRRSVREHFITHQGTRNTSVQLTTGGTTSGTTSFFVFSSYRV